MMDESRREFKNLHGRNDRFRYEESWHDGVHVFIKTARTAELAGNLDREVLWSNFMSVVAAEYPEARLRGVDIVGRNKDGGLEMEYISAPLVAASNDLDSWRKIMPRYGQMLAILDKTAQQKPNLGQEPSNSHLNGMQDIEVTWQRWLGEHIGGVHQLGEAHALVRNALPSLKMQLQHGDLTPWQIFDKEGEWVIYDGEKSGSHLPRYNDLAYGFGRLYTRLQCPEEASRLLRLFVESAGVQRDEFMKDFLPVMTFRAVGMVGDAYTDTERDYLPSATQLLEACIRGDVADFLTN